MSPTNSFLSITSGVLFDSSQTTRKSKIPRRPWTSRKYGSTRFTNCALVNWSLNSNREKRAARARAFSRTINNLRTLIRSNALGLDRSVLSPNNTIPSLRYNIPNRKQYYYAAVPTWNGDRKGVDIYTIPQPVPVDIKYSVKIICNRMRELNKFNKIILEKFASRQAYTQIKGHYIPIQMDEISDESVLDLEKRKYYMQSYDFTLMGFLIDEEEFEVKPGITRALQIFETKTSSKRRKLNKYPKNSDQVELSFSYPVGTLTYSYDFEYTTNVKLINSNNISSYEIYINNLYYGNDISQLTTGQIQVNLGDTLKIDIVKDNPLYESTMLFESTIL